MEHIKSMITPSLEKVPIGINTNTLEVATYSFSSFINMIYKENNNTYKKFISSLIYLYQSSKIKTYVIDSNHEFNKTHKN